MMKVDLPDIYNAATTFVDENIVQGRGKKTAIYYQDQQITYQEVFERVNRTGNALKALGIEIEHRVLLILPDSPEFVFSLFGAIKIGAVPIPTNPWMKSSDYEYLLNDSRARAAIVHESILPEFEKVQDQCRYLSEALTLDLPKFFGEDRKLGLNCVFLASGSSCLLLVAGRSHCSLGGAIGIGCGTFKLVMSFGFVPLCLPCANPPLGHSLAIIIGVNIRILVVHLAPFNLTGL